MHVYIFMFSRYKSGYNDFIHSAYLKRIVISKNKLAFPLAEYLNPTEFLVN